MICPFCQPVVGERVIFEKNGALVLVPHVVLSQGHCLVVTSRHIESLLKADSQEIGAVWSLANEVSNYLVDQGYADGINLLSNMGLSAGQTVFHAHVHVIPRLCKDMPNPRDWLSLEFKKREFFPEASNVEDFSKKLREHLGLKP